jgi:hypothetical protein
LESDRKKPWLATTEVVRTLLVESRKREKDSNDMSSEEADALDICTVKLLYTDTVMKGTWDGRVMVGTREQ